MPIGLEEVRDWLAPRFAGEELVWIGAGAWSTAFRFAERGRRLVIRFGRHPEDFHKDRRAAAHYAGQLPVPRVLEVGDAGPFGCYAISEWAPGRHLDALPEAELRAALPVALALLDDLRAASPPARSGFGWWPGQGDALHGSWADALLSIVDEPEQQRVAGWRTRLERDRTAAVAFDEAAGRLRELAGACPRGVRAGIHGDLTAGNVLVHQGRVSAIFDWGNSLVGDFLYDVAWLSFWSPWHPGLDADFVEDETLRRCSEAGHDVSAFAERLAACQLHIALDNMAYNAWRQDAKDLHGTVERLARLRRQIG